jgi:hypothetical protein
MKMLVAFLDPTVARGHQIKFKPVELMYGGVWQHPVISRQHRSRFGLAF